MNVSSDYYTHIGHEHVVTGKGSQDHALSVSREGVSCVVVADGCSDGRETDMGARIITFSTVSSVLQSYARNIKDKDAFKESVSDLSRVIREDSAKSLALIPRDLLATRVYAAVTDSFVYVHMEGDGVIVWEDVTGKVTLIRYDWAGNTPCYPSYDVDSFESFIKVQSIHEEQGLTEEVIEWTNEEGFVPKSLRVISIREAVHGVTHAWGQDEMKNLTLLSVMSDGVTRVQGVSWNEVVIESLRFKSMAGEFLKRRFIRMYKEWGKRGVVPLDDIACATMYFDHNEGGYHDDT